MIFRWTGVDLVNRRTQHDEILTQDVNEDYGLCLQWEDITQKKCLQKYDSNSGPQKQLEPFFYKSRPMNAIWGGDVTY